MWGGMSARVFTASDLNALNLLGRPVWVFDLDRGATFWANTGALSLFAADSVEHLRARQTKDPMSEGMRRRLENYRARFEAGEAVEERWTFYPEGRGAVPAWCRCSGIRIDDGAGARLAMLVEANPIEDDSLGANETRLVEALRHCNELISLHRLDGAAVVRNPAAEQALGPVEGAALADVFLDQDALREGVQLAREGGVFRRELPIATRQGPAWHDTELRRVVDPITAEPALLVVQHDVTARRESEERLREARTDAEAASKAKSSFLAVMSHELRTPMMGVLAAAELLRESDLDPDQREALEMVFAAGRQMVGQIEDVLDISRIEAGRIRLQLAPTDVRAVLVETLRPFLDAVERKSLTLTQAVDASVPRRVQTDRRRLAQIIGNLVTNAIKFTDEGAIDVRVGATPLEGARLQLSLSVSDSGVGMDPSQAHRLFAAFAQADSSVSRSRDGAGLGLHIVKSLAEVLGGRVRVETALGEGSTFRVILPMEAAPASDNPSAPTHPKAKLALRVLVADDNTLNRRALVRMLRRWGCEVQQASDGAEALRVAEASPPDVILMDVWMPGVDGPTATRRLRARVDALADTPVFALTADAFYLEGEGEESPFDRFLHKPVDWDLLYEALRGVAG